MTKQFPFWTFTTSNIEQENEKPITQQVDSTTINTPTLTPTHEFDTANLDLDQIQSVMAPIVKMSQKQVKVHAEYKGIEKQDFNNIIAPSTQSIKELEEYLSKEYDSRETMDEDNVQTFTTTQSIVMKNCNWDHLYSIMTPQKNLAHFKSQGINIVKGTSFANKMKSVINNTSFTVTTTQTLVADIHSFMFCDKLDDKVLTANTIIQCFNIFIKNTLEHPILDKDSLL